MVKTTNRNIVRAFALISQLGISMLTPIFLCVFIGYQLDQWLHSNIWFLVFLLLGIAAAFRNAYHLTKVFYTKDKNKDELVNDYIKELKKSNQNNENNKKK